MQKKNLLILATAMLFTACNSKPSMPRQVTYSAPTVYQTNSPIPVPIVYEEGNYNVQHSPIVAPRMLMTSAHIDVEVKEINEAQEKLNILIKGFSGHIENANLSENGHYYAVVKVPSEKLLPALDAISNLGEKTSQSIDKRDITDNFSNNEERLKNLKLFRDKMKTLLNRTNNIGEIVKIEREINRLQTEIDMIEKGLKNMQGSVDMSPINVSLEEKTIYGPIGYIGNGLWWAVKKLFVIR